MSNRTTRLIAQVLAGHDVRVTLDTAARVLQSFGSRRPYDDLRFQRYACVEGKTVYVAKHARANRGSLSRVTLSRVITTTEPDGRSFFVNDNSWLDRNEW